MIRLSLAALACLSLAGCIDWQAGYDSAARADCRQTVDPDARRACLDRVEQNASEKRADQRS